jgi:hypothetical protein
VSYKRQKALAVLRRHGVVVLREGAEHTIIGIPGGPSTSMPRHRELNRFTLRGIVRQLGLDWKIVEKDVR